MFNFCLKLIALQLYKKSIKLLPKDTLNSKIVLVCECYPYLVYAEIKYVTIDEKLKQHEDFLIKTHFYFILIKCRTDNNHVHIESFYLIGY